MKKRVASKLAIIILVLLVVVGCSGQSNTGGGSSGSSGSSGSTPGTTPSAPSQPAQESQGSADNYPEKPITIIVPYGAGGGSDLVARVVAKYLEKYIGQPVVVNNVTGQSGVVGGQAALDAEPDGYTLLNQHSGLLALYHSGLSDFTYTDFEPIALMVSGAEAIAVNGKSPYNNIQDLIEDAKNRPGELKYGFSIGGTSHYLAASFMVEAGVEMQPVSYDGESDRATALAGGHIDIVSGSFPTLSGYVESGDVKILGLVDTERNSANPDVPTLLEQGLNVTDSFVARGLFAPKGVPQERLQVLIDALEKVSQDPEYAEELANLSYDPRFIAGEDFVKYLEQQDQLIADLAERAGIKQ